MPPKPQSASPAPATPQTPAVNEYAPQDGATYFEMLATLPAAVKAYLLSEELNVTRNRIYSEFKLTDAEQDSAYYTEHEVFFGTLAVSEFAETIKGRLAWPKEKDAARLALEILGRIFLPAQAFAGDVDGAVRRLGGTPASYAVKPLETRRVTYAQGAAEIAAETGVRDPEAARRVAHNVESYFRGVRTRPQLMQILMKPRKIGGAELSESEAERIAVLADEKKKSCEFFDESADKAEAGAQKFSAKEISRRYAGDDALRRKIAVATDGFVKKTGGSPAVMRDHLHELLYPPTMERAEGTDIIGAILALAASGNLPTLLADARFAELIKKYFEAEAKEENAAQYADDPQSPRYLDPLLQMLLRGFAEFDEAESARLGMHVAARLKKAGQAEYAPDVAFDMNQGNFRWLNPVKL